MDKYDTPLSPEDEAEFARQFPDPRSTADYDMRGAFKAGVTAAGNGHFPDTFKKPNHITFSDQSQYHGKDGVHGGKWEQLEGDRWRFTASPHNLQQNDAATLQQYFKQYEPGNELVLPTMVDAIRQGLTK